MTLCMLFCAGCGTKKAKTSVHIGQEGEDAQSYWTMYHHTIVKGEQGYYYTTPLDKNGKETYMKYMDAQTGNTTFLCGKPQCNHNNKECDAILDDSYDNEIYYYKGAVYLYQMDSEDGLIYLVKVKPDGSERQRLFPIGVGDGEWGAYSLVFREDAVYIYMRQGATTGLDEVTAGIRRRSLDGREDAMIYEYTGMGATVHDVRIYGDKLFFLVEEMKRTPHQAVVDYERKGLFVYDCQTKKVEQVVDAAICDYTIDKTENQLYYYVVQDGLYKQDLSAGTGKKIYTYKKGQTDICELSFDGTYLYMTNEIYWSFYFEKPESYDLYICDKDANIIKTMTTPGPFATMFGDSAYMFSRESGLGKGKMRYIRKEEMLTSDNWNAM